MYAIRWMFRGMLLTLAILAVLRYREDPSTLIERWGELKTWIIGFMSNI
jgi:hypothetical protein